MPRWMQMTQPGLEVFESRLTVSAWAADWAALAVCILTGQLDSPMQAHKCDVGGPGNLCTHMMGYMQCTDRS